VRCGVRIELGDIGDYQSLARWHYRAGSPAVPVRVLRAMERRRLVGVLVVTMPTLMGRWRGVAWPELELDESDRRARIAIINQRVRRIGRVVVDPRDRGRGIARQLVRTYLDDPLSTHTEAIAAMGRHSPFLQAAGMRRVELAPPARDLELRRDLRRLGVPPWRLADLSFAERSPHAGLRAALQRWASRAQHTRKLADEPDKLALAAAAAACAPPAIFVTP